MKKIYYILLLVCMVSHVAVSQSETEEGYFYSKENNTHLGVGIGLTYGGLGGRVVHSPSKSIGLFLGLGYQVVSVGYNVGMMYYIPSSTRTQGYLSGMFGANGAIKVEGLSELDGSYAGVSFGFGVLLNSRANPGNYWDLGLIAPVRSTNFKDDWDAIKNNSGISVEQDLLPVLINIGYNFKM